MAIVVDEDAYPFVLQGFAHTKGEPALHELFARMSVIAKRAIGNDTVHVVVAVGDERFTAAERKLLAEQMAIAPKDEVARVVGAFAVIESSFARGVLTALRWLSPDSIPVVTASTPDEAIDLGLARLTAHGVAVPATVSGSARAAAKKLHAALRPR
ncbi:MAG TPA: hypothetical protein VGG39_19135 [Polyangiaceae bacterium]|jgi:hypothetical protein